MQAKIIASGPFQAVECLEQIERARERKIRHARLGRGPAAIAGRVAEMAADVEPGPIIVARSDARFHQISNGALGTNSALAARHHCDEAAKEKPFQHDAGSSEPDSFAIYRLSRGPK